MPYAVYDIATGEIAKIVSCPDFAIEANVGEGQSAVSVESGVDDVRFHIVNGEAELK